MSQTPVRLTQQDLRGRPAISYLRFSSNGQRFGDSTDRQRDILGEVLAHFGLVPDHSLVDRALSASKVHHLTKGRLGDLVAMVKRGEIPRGTVPVIEAIDRLFRGGAFDVYPCCPP